MNARGWWVVSVIVVACAAAAVVVWHMHRGEGQGESGGMAHGRTAFTFTVAANKSVVFPLFGASGERAWGTHGNGHPWDPHFIWPVPERDVEGEVFTITHHGAHHSKTATWINTAFDPESGHVQYVYFLPGDIVTRIDIHVTEPDPVTTKVDVIYDQTALNSAVNASIQERTQHDDDMAKEWQQQITAALQK
jgi:hypothetical protein